MGLFKKKITDQLYAGSQFFQNGRVAGKPKDRRDFYAKAIEAARKSDNTAVRNADIENYICFLLTDTGPKADLGLVRRLIAQQEPEEQEGGRQGQHGQIQQEEDPHIGKMVPAGL